MKQFAIDKINTLEDYLCHLGLAAIALNALQHLQERALRIGILSHEEEELAETTKHEIKRLMITIDDLLHFISERTPMDYKQLITNKLKEKTNE